MAQHRPLSEHDVSDIAHEYAELFGYMLDNVPCGYNLNYSDAVAAAARMMVVDVPSAFRQIVARGTGASQEEVQAMPWPTVVKTGCAIIEATRDAWPDGTLQPIIADAIRPYSTLLNQARQ
ncbi:hypothetical protein HL653_02600 [Sphingomonas sp. AP4-R1]|uniref:hypothetical protein n=1 Tax=Sphingomonas sp. AP4-R1 TaxID=2735134 RepID=UPI0014935F02|nr:hypothetical protein [Sphingomonas sp. AP4-R1]QJU56824.1 hypothetical protein HL653_02600 [Sphingomonas sp. AP4-R1]